LLEKSKKVLVYFAGLKVLKPKPYIKEVCTEIQVHARRLVLRSSSSSGMWNPLGRLVQALISSFPHTYVYSQLVQWPNDPSLNKTQFVEKFGPSDFWFGRLIWILLDANGELALSDLD